MAAPNDQDDGQEPSPADQDLTVGKTQQPGMVSGKLSINPTVDAALRSTKTPLTTLADLARSGVIRGNVRNALGLDIALENFDAEALATTIRSDLPPRGGFKMAITVVKGSGRDGAPLEGIDLVVTTASALGWEQIFGAIKTLSDQGAHILRLKAHDLSVEEVGDVHYHDRLSYGENAEVEEDNYERAKRIRLAVLAFADDEFDDTFYSDYRERTTEPSSHDFWNPEARDFRTSRGAPG